MIRETEAGKQGLRERELERFMASKTLEEQLTEVLFAPWGRRMELILASPRARELVRAMPQQELFWTVKAAGPESSLHLLELALPEQIQFFLDLDWWIKDELVPEKIMSWLLVLFELGKGFNLEWIRWLHQKDPWLIAAILPLFVRVEKRPDHMEVQEARDLLPAFTLDDIYYLAFRNDKIAPAMAMLAANLLEASPAIYRDVMETMLTGTVSENREKALKLRRARLNDLGLTDYHDSLDIYAPLKPEQMHVLGQEGVAADHAAADLPMPAFIPTLYLEDAPLFMQAAQKLQGSSHMARIVYETVGAVNKIMMVEMTDLDDPDSITKTVKRAFGLINLGLESVVSRLGMAPEDVLSGRYVEELVRVGFSALRPIRRAARSILASSSSKFLPAGKRQMLEALSRTTPVYLAEQEAEERPFTSAVQLQEALRAVIEADLLLAAAGSVVPAPDEWNDRILKVVRWEGTNLLSPDEFDIEVALETAAANLLLGRGLNLIPLKPEDLKALRELFSNIDKDEEALEEKVFELADRMISGIEDIREEKRRQGGDHQPALGKGQLRDQIGALAQKLVHSIRHQVTETGEGPGEEGPDSRFISGILVQTE